MSDPAAAPAASADPETFVCQDLDRAIALFVQLGLRLDMIFPADNPAVAALSGHDARVRLVRADAGAVELPSLAELPPVRPSFVVTDGSDASWKVGRAGMQYRDLIPDRQGGRYIASHIRIPDGGPVPDYVHFHAIEFQIIYCYQGWVRVVYEDQGEPFVMQAGDCVLQPPGIRHRVLEASPGLEVIEISAPAIHATHVDHDRTLPTATLEPDRDYGGQRFVRYQPATGAPAEPSTIAGFDASELGMLAATRGVGSVRVLRVRDPDSVNRGPAYRHGADLLFHFVLRGQLTLDGTYKLGATASFVVPPGQPFMWREASPDLKLLQIALPGELALERI